MANKLRESVRGIETNQIEEMKDKNAKIYLTAICFARMYGVFETLEDIPNADFETISKMMLIWAEEYLHSGQDNIVAFFEQKSDVLKKR